MPKSRRGERPCIRRRSCAEDGIATMVIGMCDLDKPRYKFNLFSLRHTNNRLSFAFRQPFSNPISSFVSTM
jgi:hypothetical protein